MTKKTRERAHDLSVATRALGGVASRMAPGSVGSVVAVHAAGVGPFQARMGLADHSVTMDASFALILAKDG